MDGYHRFFFCYYLNLSGPITRSTESWCDIAQLYFQKAIDRIREAIKEDVNNLSSQIDELEEGIMMEEFDEDWWYGENQ